VLLQDFSVPLVVTTELKVIVQPVIKTESESAMTLWKVQVYTSGFVFASSIFVGRV